MSERWWAALLAATALWEIFLRVDSRVLTPAAKVWLFALLVVAFVVVGVAVIRVLGGIARRMLGPEHAARLARPAFVAGATGIVGVEYAFLTLHHPFGPLWYMVVVAAGAGALAWLVTSRGAQADVGEAALGTPVLVPVAFAVGVAFAVACTRPDVGTALIKRNTALGRALGHGLALVPRRIADAGPVTTRPPDLVASRPLGRSSVVVLTIDALRRDGLAPYNGRRDTSPRLAAFADDAVVFDDAWAQVPSSAPSIATLWTGLFPARHHLRENRMALDLGMTTVAEMLGDAGYATAAFVTNPNFAPGFHLDQGFATYHYVPATEREYGLLLDASDPVVVDEAIEWARTARRPMLLWVHVMAPHSPYLPPADLRPPSEPSGPWFDVWNMGGDSRIAPGHAYFDLGRYRRAYAAEVRSADRLAARLFDGLGAAGVLEDAHVIVTADHGEAFGEHDVFWHGRSFDPGEAGVPLLWRLPGAAHGGTRVATTMQTADVAPTLLRLLDVTHGRLDGRDLSAAVVGEMPGDDGFAYTQARFLGSMGARGLLYAVRTRKQTLWLDAAYGYDGEFDRVADPNEERMDRYRGPRDAPLRRTLETMAHDSQANLHASVAGTLDPKQIEQLRALGYVQ